MPRDGTLPDKAEAPVDGDIRLVAKTATEGRAADLPSPGFVGTLQVDGYAGYKVLAERNAVNLALCWAHVRRKLYELAQSGPAPIATEALARVAALYQVESEIRAAPPRNVVPPGRPSAAPSSRRWNHGSR